ncbi:MAG: hypothetical protein DIZ80_07025 [endosymbiont of Galathealinum brachiosum]|uniref:TonB-dependent receptor n=1 Tax=endosymbiont of Galathealinum brachiosum TaxID=2200906 RepID=A0A370DG71_9GAMM|nr:MAG: hypothetical protein DIZ80_07025 [endosymbiont of Galathealinum brachiosum]
MRSILIGISVFTSSTLLADYQLEDLLSMSLTELLQVDITGSTLTAEKLVDVPSAVTVFTHRQISRMGLDSLDELVALVPGYQSFRMTAHPLNYPTPVRGSSMGSVINEILVLVDGQRVNEPRSGGASDSIPKISLVNIERIEFIRGPGSAIYGSNAMVGVINIITRSNVNEVSVAYGSFNRKKVYLLATQKTQDFSVDVFVHFDEDKGDDYLLQDTFSANLVETQDQRELADLDIKLNWQSTQLQILHNQSKSKDFYEQNNISNGFNGHEAEVSSIALKHEFNYRSVESYVRLSYSASRWLTAGQLTPEGSVPLFLSGGASSDALLAIGEFDDVSESSLLWHSDWQINTDSSLQYGIDLRHFDIPETIVSNNYDLADFSNGNLPIRYYGELLATTPVQAKSSRDILGMYVQYQQRIFDNTRLTLGLRYDEFSHLDSEFSPRIAFVHTINRHHSLKALYGEAFRAPSENELNLLNNPVLIGNPDLKSESVKSFDLIWMGQWDYTSFSLGYFQNNFKDSIVQVDLGGVFQFENTDQDPSRGVEFEISHEFNRNWLLRANYTYLNDIPDLSFREANQMGALMLNYQKGKYNINLISSYLDNRTTLTGGDSNNTPLAINDYWLLDAKINYNITHDLYVFLQAKNLLNEEYQTPSTSNSLIEGTDNRGIELLTGLVWGF